MAIRATLVVRFVALALASSIAPWAFGAEGRGPGLGETGDSKRSVADGVAAPTLADAYRRFYNGDYKQAAEAALAVRTLDPENLAAYELRASAIHFQLRRELGDGTDRRRALASCAACPVLLAQFSGETTEGRRLSRVRLSARAEDESASFFLGKLDLNYLWLQLETLGRRTGWNEYWEARRTLDAVLSRNPAHVRARVARAWMEYIVDTRLPWGTKWLMGGGDRKRALLTVRAAAEAESDLFAETEAAFALWEMLVRERRISEAIEIAQQLARDYPDNQDLARFLRRHADTAASQASSRASWAS
jgi:tetratricopeptide (TPR) repeat protein